MYISFFQLKLFFSLVSSFSSYTTFSSIITLSLHAALPIFARLKPGVSLQQAQSDVDAIAADIREQHPTSKSAGTHFRVEDRKSTRLNSSHLVISYAVFCLKKKKRSYTLIMTDLINYCPSIH